MANNKRRHRCRCGRGTHCNHCHDLGNVVVVFCNVAPKTCDCQRPNNHERHECEGRHNVRDGRNKIDGHIGRSGHNRS